MESVPIDLLTLTAGTSVLTGHGVPATISDEGPHRHGRTERGPRRPTRPGSGTAFPDDTTDARSNAPLGARF
ncbi:UNVERIFIED_CONTAM: hypothetical protein RF653_16750 [Kocuria sp. CPCC 205316]|uniref:hypothetical protein n=1 Tax=Kocuria TaxID=57493 RepID=UPI0036D92A3F